MYEPGEGGAFVVHLKDRKDVRWFNHRLTHRGPLLRIIGTLLVAQARKAFDDQRLGDEIWPVRYPQQPDPFINVAPVVFWAGQGQAPIAQDFQRSPAMMPHSTLDETDIRNRVAFKVTSENEVEAGHPEPWAGRMQFGGSSVIPITDTTRFILGTWLAKASGKKVTLRGASKKRGTAKVETPGTKHDYAKKLAFVFFRDRMNTRAYPRPFLGMTERLWEDCNEMIGRHLAGTAGAA